MGAKAVNGLRPLKIGGEGGAPGSATVLLMPSESVNGSEGGPGRHVGGTGQPRIAAVDGDGPAGANGVDGVMGDPDGTIGRIGREGTSATAGAGGITEFVAKLDPVIEKLKSAKDMIGERMPSMEQLKQSARDLEQRVAGDEGLRGIVQPLLDKIDSLFQ